MWFKGSNSETRSQNDIVIIKPSKSDEQIIIWSDGKHHDKQKGKVNKQNKCLFTISNQGRQTGKGWNEKRDLSFTGKKDEEKDKMTQKKKCQREREGKAYSHKEDKT